MLTSEASSDVTINKEEWWTELLSNHSPLLYTLSLLSIVSTPHNHTLHPSLLPSPSPNTLSSVFHRIPILSKSPYSLFHGIKHSFSPSLSIPSSSFKSSISAKKSSTFLGMCFSRFLREI
ncbi:hypothetical protein Gotur_026039 [Gossypium turneri]